MMPMTSEFYIRNIANVVHSWMSYIYEVSDTKHFAAESSLRYPIAGLLERKKSVNLFMEDGHPMFNNARVDFKWEEKGEIVYLELKHVRDVSINVQEIFDDIFRLAFINDAKAHKYFLLCGESTIFEKRIRQRTIIEEQATTQDTGKVKIKQSGGDVKYLFDNYFSFETNEMNQIGTKVCEFNCENTYYNTFKDTYSPKCKVGMEIPSKIKVRTNLMQPIDKGLRSAVAIWKVEMI